MAQKIAIIGIRGIPARFPGSSGIDTYIEQLLPHLSKNEITLYARSWTKTAQKKLPGNIKNVSIPCLHHKYLDTGIYTILSTIIALLGKSEIFWYQAPGSCLLIKLAKLFHKKTIVTIHGIDWQRQKWSFPLNRWFLKSIESLAVKNADFCTGVSQDICQYIQTTYQKKCVLTPSSLINHPPQPRKIISKKIKISDKQPYILYLGRLVPEKKVDLLIQAFNESPIINQKYKFIISGLVEKNLFCRSIVALVKKNPNIILTGYVSGQFKNELLSNCDLFVLPSTLEGNPMSINEALGFNRKCLISDIPVHQQYQKEFSNVTLFTTNSLTDLKHKLKLSLENKFSQKKSINHSWTKTAKNYIEIFEKI